MDAANANTSKTFIGAMTLAVIVSAMACIIWFSSGLTAEHKSIYTIYFSESVSGLNEDAAVEFNGVRVGSVKDIDIDTYNPRLVKLQINVDKGTPITRGTVATITTYNFISGISIISLTDKNQDINPIPIHAGESYPVIASTPSTSTRILTIVNQLKTNFASISSLIRTSFSPGDMEVIKHAGINTKIFIKLIVENSQNFHVIYNHVSTLGTEMGPVLILKNYISDMITIQMLPIIDQLLSNIDKISATLAEAKDIIKEHPTVLIRGLAPPPPGPYEKKP